MGAQLRADSVVAGYSINDSVLRDVSFRVDEGEIVCVIGPNGAGKSTLFKAIAGLLPISAGKIELDGRPIANLDPRTVAAGGIAFVPQEQNVFPSLSVYENLEMGGYTLRAARAVRTRIDALLQRFPELAEKRRLPARALSGGQRQILAVASTMMMQPSLLLLDEPSAGLSPVASMRLFDTLREINRDGVSIAMVEQNAVAALRIAQRGYILVDGRNRHSGPARELAEDPQVRKIFLGGR